ncbi:MAG: hypothetical protein HY878_05600 [Deltaproteobacteria bacterium]|nr:hypothetical protein [Deltaproteobacteria bacterium]
MNQLLPICLIVLIPLSACGVPFQKASQPFYYAHDIRTTYAVIQEEKSTEEDLLRWLGRPTIEGLDTLGRKKWIYLSSPTSEKEIRLDVIFKDGVVVDYRLDASDGAGGELLN